MLKGASIMEGIIGIVVSLLVAAYTMPSAINAIANATFSDNVSVAVTSMFTIALPIVAIAAILIWFVYQVRSS